MQMHSRTIQNQFVWIYIVLYACLIRRCFFSTRWLALCVRVYRSPFVVIFCLSIAWLAWFCWEFFSLFHAKFIYSERTLLTVSNPLLKICVVWFGWVWCGVAQFDLVLISRNMFIVPNDKYSIAKNERKNVGILEFNSDRRKNVTSFSLLCLCEEENTSFAALWMLIIMNCGRPFHSKHTWPTLNKHRSLDYYDVKVCILIHTCMHLAATKLNLLLNDCCSPFNISYHFSHFSSALVLALVHLISIHLNMRSRTRHKHAFDWFSSHKSYVPEPTEGQKQIISLALPIIFATK